MSMASERVSDANDVDTDAQPGVLAKDTGDT